MEERRNDMRVRRDMNILNQFNNNVITIVKEATSNHIMTGYSNTYWNLWVSV
jgi:hypothetical protein